MCFLVKAEKEEDIEEDIYSESFDEESKKSDKRDVSDLEESKVTDRPPKGKTLGQKLINRFANNDFDDEIDGSATLDFNLTKTGSIQDSLPYPIGGGPYAKGKISKEAYAERAAKIEKLTKRKDPFSSYVREQNENEDEIPEDTK